MKGEDEKEVVEDDVEFHFTLFSDIKQNFKGIRENVSEKIYEDMMSSAYREEFIEDICVVEDADEDLPLAMRLSQLSEQNNSKVAASTRPTGRNRSRNIMKQPEARDPIASEVVIDTFDLSDSDCEILSMEPRLKDIYESKFSSGLEDCLDTSIEEINIEEDENSLVSVKVNWMDLRVYRFELRKHQTFSSVFCELAEKENVPRERILLILRDKIFVKTNDTPDSLKLSIIDILEGGITKEVYTNVSEERDKEETGKDMLGFKCVLKDRKKPLTVFIKKTDAMHCLMIKTAEQLECSLEKLKFMFEGELLEMDVTPDDLDLEGGEIIDVLIKE